MSDFAGAVAAIEVRVAANWATTPIGYMNDDPPETRNGATGTPEPWVLVEVVGSDSRIQTAGKPGSRSWVDDGLIHCHVFVPKGTGRATARVHAVALGEIFRGALFYNDTPGHYVRTWSPRIDRGGNGDDDGLWFRVTATIPFEYWHRG